MASQKQTKSYWLTETSTKVIIDVMFYIWYFFRLYFFGAFALLRQLLEKSTAIKALPLQSGKTAIVTGGAAGIGFHITKHLVSLGAHVIIASRSRKQAESAIAKIKENQPEAEVEFMSLDLASFNSVRKFADDFLSKDWPLHILINNGGVMLVPCQNTEDGFEYHLQVNFLSHALLTSLLLDKMECSAALSNTVVSVVNVSSVAHEAAIFRKNIFEGCEDNWSYSSHNAYAVSKLAIVMYTYALSRRLTVMNSPVVVNAVHPGIVNTNLYCHVHPPISWALGILKNFLFMLFGKECYPSPASYAGSPASNAGVHYAINREAEGVY